jgi:hypothetical protein
MSELIQPSSDALFLRATQFLVARRFLDQPTSVTVVEPPKPDRPGSVMWFRVESFAALEEERATELATDLCDTLHSGNATWLLWVRGRSGALEFRFGIVRDRNRKDSQQLLERALESYMLGASFRKIEADVDAAPEHEHTCVILGIPSERVNTRIETRLDEAYDSLAGRDFDLVVRMEPVPQVDIDAHLQQLGALTSEIHSLASIRLSRQVEASKTSEQQASFLHRVADSKTTDRYSNQSSGTSTEQDGAGRAAVAGLSTIVGAIVGGLATGGAGVALGAQLGGMLGGTFASAMPRTTTRDDSTVGVSTSIGRQVVIEEQDVERVAEQQRHLQSLTMDQVNRNAQILAETFDARLARLVQATGHGVWRTTVTVSAPSAIEAETAGHIFVGALRGDSSHLETVRVVPVPALDDRSRALLVGGGGLKFEVDPRLAELQPYVGCTDLATWLAGTELAYWVRPPVRPIAGLSMRPFVELTSFVPSRAGHAGSRLVRLGPMLHHGRELPGRMVALRTDDLTRHCLVAGTTGSGKTSTVQHILRNLRDSTDDQGQLPFLVIEPAKTEYRELFSSLRDKGARPLRLVPNPTDAELASGDASRLQFNPFVAQTGVSLGRHFEATKILLRSCFTMQESLPQLLEAVLLDAYAECGWQPADFGKPVPTDLGGRTWPTFRGMTAESHEDGKVKDSLVRRTIKRFGYNSEANKGLTAALTVRLASFSIGSKGLIFNVDEGGMDWDGILQRPVFIELSEIPEPDVRRFLVGALMIRLGAHRALAGASKSLRHLVVLEEAHHVLRHDSGNSSSAALIRESNLLLADAFAEMRAYGQGILVADQSPAELEPAILRNTGTKILHTSYYEADVRAIADSIGLDEDQRQVLRRLAPGECVVKSPEIQMPVLCKVSAGLRTKEV